MSRENEFSNITQASALIRQKFRCGSCGTKIFCLGEVGRRHHAFGETARAHHIFPVKFGGTNAIDNCVIICEACHYSVHEDGNYCFGTVVGETKDFPYFNGDEA